MLSERLDVADSEDILLALLVHATDRGTQPLTAHGSDIQNAIYAMSTNKQYASLLTGFVFSSSGPIPYSPAVEDALGRLSTSGMVYRENPRWERLRVTPAAVRFYDERLAKEIGASIGSAAEEFKQSL